MSVAIFCYLLATIMLVVNADNFMAADTNGDGALDRKEFAMYLHKIDTSISSLLTVPDDLTAEVDKDASIGFDLESLTRGTDFVHGCFGRFGFVEVVQHTFAFDGWNPQKSYNISEAMQKRSETNHQFYLVFLSSRFSLSVSPMLDSLPTR